MFAKASIANGDVALTRTSVTKIPVLSKKRSVISRFTNNKELNLLGRSNESPIGLFDSELRGSIQLIQ